MTHILIAEDDRDIREGLVDTLESEGYSTVAVDNGHDAIEAGRSGAFDLIMLDVMMPGATGYEVCESLRRHDPYTPIVMLTAKGEEIDKVIGLTAGADDYLTKPFGIHELLARIHALLRRSKLAQETAHPMEPFCFGQCNVDPGQLRVRNAHGSSSLTPRELALLVLFHNRPQQVLSRSYLLENAWGIDYLGTTRTLDQHIAQLRKKIEVVPARPRVIKTVHGAGYRYEPEDRPT